MDSVPITQETLEGLKIVWAGIIAEKSFPAILLSIVVAYLTILISVAIAIFSEKKVFNALDRNVILDHIVNSKRWLHCSDRWRQE